MYVYIRIYVCILLKTLKTYYPCNLNFGFCIFLCIIMDV